MKIRITKNHVDALCVLIGVLGMGSLYFQVLRMPLMAAMLIASILLLTRAHHPKISAQNVRLTLLLTAALLLTSFVNPQNGIHINDIVIWLCNIGYVLVLPEEQVEETINRIQAFGMSAWSIGTVARRTGDGEQVVVNFDKA